MHTNTDPLEGMHGAFNMHTSSQNRVAKEVIQSLEQEELRCRHQQFTPHKRGICTSCTLSAARLITRHVCKWSMRSEVLRVEANMHLNVVQTTKDAGYQWCIRTFPTCAVSRLAFSRTKMKGASCRPEVVGTSFSSAVSMPPIVARLSIIYRFYQSVKKRVASVRSTPRIDLPWLGSQCCSCSRVSRDRQACLRKLVAVLRGTCWKLLRRLLIDNA